MALPPSLFPGARRAVLRLPGDRRAARHGLRGLRARPRDAQVPLPGGGRRLRLRGPRRLPEDGWQQGRGLRAGRADSAGDGGPPDLHADALGKPLLAARLQPLERINSRIDRVYGMESHFVRGRAKMALRCNLIVAVMMATALGHVRAGRPEMMRSLVRGPDLKAARGLNPTARKPCRTRRRAMRRARDSGPGPRSARNRRSRAAQGSMRTGTRQRKWLPQPMVTGPMSGQGSRRSRKTLQRKCLGNVSC